MVLKRGLAKSILLNLALGLDFHKQYMSYRAIRSRAYYGYYHTQSVYNAVSRLLSVGDIQKVFRNGQVYIRLTSNQPYAGR